MKSFIALCLSLGVAACAQNPAAPSNQFVIKVDSIGAPLEAAPGAELTAKFFGTVGGSSCYSLRRVDQILSFTETEFTFVGEKCASGGGFDIVIRLDHSVIIRPRLAGDHTLRVHQPDGSVLTKVVVVR